MNINNKMHHTEMYLKGWRDRKQEKQEHDVFCTASLPAFYWLMAVDLWTEILRNRKLNLTACVQLRKLTAAQTVNKSPGFNEISPTEQFCFLKKP
jgi:hypothetical protein